MLSLAATAGLVPAGGDDRAECDDSKNWLDEYGEGCSSYAALRYPSRVCCSEGPLCDRELLRNCPVTCNACPNSPLPPNPPQSPQLPLSSIPPIPLWSGEIVATTLEGIISAVNDGANGGASVLIVLPPGTHIRLQGSQIVCAASTRLRLRSPGAGATLDGEGRSRIFYLSGGCSLELEGLRLSMGMQRGAPPTRMANSATVALSTPTKTSGPSR